MKKKIRQLLREEFKDKYAVQDRIEQHLILKILSEGAFLYVEDQPAGPDSDVGTWTARAGVTRDKCQRRVMGRDLKNMQERHWITYDRIPDKFSLTDDGRAELERYEVESKGKS